MKPLKTVLVAAMVAVSGAGTVAQSPQFTEELTVRGLPKAWSGDYILSFSGPVALPGVSLAAGTYIFRRPTGNVLQVLSANRQRAYALMQTIPTHRLDTTGQAVVFGEPLSAGAPPRIVAWFPPGSASGQELIYRQ